MPSRAWHCWIGFAGMAVQLTDAPESVLAIMAEADLVQVRQLLRAESARAGLGLVDLARIHL